jgi:hypothetical protein
MESRNLAKNEFA